jgi:SNF2 family DNA or RNA helicase
MKKLNLHANKFIQMEPTSSSMTLEIEQWLAEMKKALDPAQESQNTVVVPRRIAYCIEKIHSWNASNRYGFNLRPIKHLKKGSVIEARKIYVDLINPSKFLNQEDIILFSRHIGILNFGSTYEDSFSAKRHDWDRFLDSAASFDGLYFSPDIIISGKPTSHVKLSAGPPVAATAEWEVMLNGSARPILKLEREGLILLPFSPLRYIDPQAHTYGPLVSSLPDSVLSKWHHGPLVAAVEVDAVVNQLANLPELKPFSLLKNENCVVHSGLLPQPHLRLTRLTVGVFRQSFIIGQIHFRYPVGPILWPIKKAPNSRAVWKDDQCRNIIIRDAEAEQKFLDLLGSCGLEPLAKHVSSADLNDDTRYSVITSYNLKNHVHEWVEFMDSEDYKKLIQAGWVIAVDPGLGFDVHDVVDYFPDIDSETAHGIDWFRFDVCGEFNGKCFSLIPRIADAIRSGLLEYLPFVTEDEDIEVEKSTDDYFLSDDESDESFDDSNYLEASCPLRLPEYLVIPCDDPADGYIKFSSARFIEICRQVAHLFRTNPIANGPIRIDRLGAADLARSLSIDSSETVRSLARLSQSLKDLREMPAEELPKAVCASLRPYQLEGFYWLQFLARHGLHGILADDMGLGKTLQTLAHLAAEHATMRSRPSLVIAPTSVVPNWTAEAAKFVPSLNVLTLHGPDRAAFFNRIPDADLVITSYPLLSRDLDELIKHDWHILALDEAQQIKNPKAITAQSACKLKAAHRLCLSGTPMENHLGELWSLMRFLMPGFLGEEKSFNIALRKTIERDRSTQAQLALNRRVSPLILRRTKDQVAKELPAKTEIIHHIDLTKKQTDLYESVRAAMDKRVRDAIAEKGMRKSHIIALDALLKLRQICCHPQLLKSAAAEKVLESAKLSHLTDELLPTLLEEGRRILLFSQFTSMLALIEAHLEKAKIPFIKLTGQTQDRASLVDQFQGGEVPIFLISLKAGGTGLNLTAADTVIHYDPWWNPAAENQATDRAHRIGQTKPVFVHKLVCRGTIEDRILDLQKHKSALVEALLSEETSKLKIDAETLSHLLAPLESI